MPALVASFRRPMESLRLSRTDRALAGLGARFDDFMLRRWMRGDAPPRAWDPSLVERLRAAHRFYADPALLAEPAHFFHAPSAPAAVEESVVRGLAGGACVDVSFPTTFRPLWDGAHDDFARFVENGVAHARWWRHDRPARAAVVCLHGYASGDPRIDALAFGARRLYRTGLDVLLYTLPFHGRRRPPGERSGHGFFDVELGRTNEAFAQAMHETRTLMDLAMARGIPAIGAFGMSLGAYATALLAAIEPRLAFAIAMIPVASLPDLVWGEPLHRNRRVEAEAHGMTLARFREMWQVHAPLLRRPLVPRDRRLVIGAIGDRICPPGHAHALWSHWERPSVHWFPGGHLAQFRRGSALRAARRFIHRLGLTGRH